MAPDDVKLERISSQLAEKLLDLGDDGQTKTDIQKAGDGATAAPEDTKASSDGEKLQEIGMVNKSHDHQDVESAKSLVLANGRLNKCQGYGACGGGPKLALGPLEASLTLKDSNNKHGQAQKLNGSCLEKSLNGRFVSVSLGESQKGERRLPSNGGKDSEEKCELCFVQRLAKVIPCLGILMSLCASVFLGTAGMLVKLTESVHGIEVAVFRALIQMIIYAFVISCRRIDWIPKRDEMIPVAMRATLGGISITFSYYALKLIPLGDATTIRFSLPVWTLIMSYFFLHESCSLYKIAAVVISISGVVLVTKPDDCVYWFYRFLSLFQSSEQDANIAMNQYQTWQSLHNSKEIEDIEGIALMVGSQDVIGIDLAQQGNFSLVSSNGTSLLGFQHPQVLVGAIHYDPLRQVEGCMMALAASICLSISIIALRLCKQTPSEITILWLSITSVGIGSLTLLALGEWTVPDNFRDYLYIVLNGVCGSLGQWFMTNSLKVEQSGLIALARTFDIEVAFLYSALLLGEEIRITSVLGSILVSLGVVTVVIPKWLGCAQASKTTDDEGDEGDDEQSERHRTGDGENSSSSLDDLEAQRRHQTTSTTVDTLVSSASNTKRDYNATPDARQGPINAVGIVNATSPASR